jgi:predicted metal-dependent hydrolase
MKSQTTYFKFKNLEIEILRSDRKSIALELNRKGQILLRLPNRCQNSQILSFLEMNAEFISKITVKSESLKNNSVRLGVDGESFWLNGDVYILRIEDSIPKSVIDHSKRKILLKTSEKPAIDKIKKMLKKIAAEKVQDTLLECAYKMNIKPVSIQLSSARTKWGSCSRKGEIKLNWRLICSPDEVLRYVCIHELAHILHFNHSDKFWNTVASQDPDYKKHRKWLKERGYILNWF